MKTRIYDLCDTAQFEEAMADAAQTIRSGGLVVFPTETVYGLGANALNEEAVARIFQAKGRPSDNPLIVHAADRQMIDDIAQTESEPARTIIRELMPGPITVILKKKQTIPMIVTAGLGSVAVRMPDRDTALELIRRSGVPIAAPSANLSGKPSPTRPEHVLEDMNGKVDVILLDGDCLYGVESTVLDCTVKPARILRPGAVTQEQLSEVIELDPMEKVPEQHRPKSPGMKYRHYKPKASVIGVEGSMSEAVKYINEQIAKNPGKDAVLAFDECIAQIRCGHILSLGKADEPQQNASVLFAHFRKCDHEGIRTIYVMCPKEEGIGRAFLNRLKKAADQMVVLSI